MPAVPLDTEAAKVIGSRARSCGHSDVVDVHVAIAAERHRAAVVTSDRLDITAVSPALVDRIVDI